MARLGIQLPVIEKVLNQLQGSFRGIVRVYQRHSFADEKRQALDAWASFVQIDRKRQEARQRRGVEGNMIKERATELIKPDDVSVCPKSFYII